MDIVSRPHYYSKLEKLLGKGVLIVLTGQRRVLFRSLTQLAVSVSYRTSFAE